MRCPFAIWHPLNGGAGKFSSGPYKIVHHTTEGSTAEGAFTALGSAHSDSHFVVDDRHIYQLIDTSEASRSLRNQEGGVQTNKDSAIQIEMVGRAGAPKNRDTLALQRKLCRWLEEVHEISPIWPNGYPKTFKKVSGKIGQDPGGHNRDAKTWDTVSGHYGHSQVPENTHWDPGYTQEEVDFLMADTAVPSAAVITDPPPSETVVVSGVKPDTLNLRSVPNGKLILGTLPEGTKLAVVKREGRWTKVSTPFGAVGWVYDKFVTAVK